MILDRADGFIFFSIITFEVMPYDTNASPTKSYSYYFNGTAPERISITLKANASDFSEAHYFYDGFANLVQVKANVENNKQIVKNIFYDEYFRVRAEQNPYFDDNSSGLSNSNSSVNKTFYTYDVLDRVTAVLNPDGTSKNTSFNKTEISDYDENGNRHKYVLDGYDRITKVYEYLTNESGDNETYTTTYEYNTNDNLIKITDALGNNFTFTYDSLGRKIKMSDPDLGNWTYVYDSEGNLIEQTGSGNGLITGDGYYREYNQFGQLIRVRSGNTVTSPILEEYFYDPYGERVKIKKYDSANTTIYTPFKELLRITNSSGTYDYIYIYDDNTLVARKNPDGTKYYYHADHLGSTTYITNESGAVIENVSYTSFGEIISSNNAEKYKLYTGQFNDEETNQYYYGARYYKPSTAQFIQPDTIIQNTYNPQSLNRYAYVLNNPYRYTDPNGLWAVQFGLSYVGGLIIGNTFGGGLAFGYTEEEGFQKGFYTTIGTGAYGGLGISALANIAFAPGPNTNIKDIRGTSSTIGGSGRILGSPVVGVEKSTPTNIFVNKQNQNKAILSTSNTPTSNVPMHINTQNLDGNSNIKQNANPTYSGNIGLGVGTPEIHDFTTQTKVYQPAFVQKTIITIKSFFGSIFK